VGNHYFKNLSNEEYLNFVKKFIRFDTKQFESNLNELLLIFKPQLSYALQINDLVNETFIENKLENLSDEIKQFIKSEEFKLNIKTLKEVLSKFEVINLDNGIQIINEVKQISNLNGKNLYMPIRIAAIYREHGPELHKILTIVGKQTILNNIKEIEKF